MTDFDAQKTAEHVVEQAIAAIQEKNRYDTTDFVRLHNMMRAGPLKLAAYTVRDPETLKWSNLQFHMTWDNHVMAVMSENAAKLFADFVQNQLAVK